MGSRQQVLIVASDVQCRAMLSDILQGWNLEATAVSSIQEAKAAVKKLAPLLVVCEENPSDATCCDLFSAIASSRAAGRWVALIHDEANYYDILSRGAFDAIPIPCRRTDLQWIIIHALSAKDGSRRRTRS
jgi:DNA-binding NtrC family response regulator